jgi:hypothetical protein
LQQTVAIAIAVAAARFRSRRSFCHPAEPALSEVEWGSAVAFAVVFPCLQEADAAKSGIKFTLSEIKCSGTCCSSAFVFAIVVAFLVVIPQGSAVALAVACFLYPNQRIVISTEAAHAFVSSAVEKSASRSGLCKPLLLRTAGEPERMGWHGRPARKNNRTARTYIQWRIHWGRVDRGSCREFGADYQV